MGIQALGSLASRLSTDSQSIDVKFSYDETDGVKRNKEMHIDNDNVLVLQRYELPPDTKSMQIEATGSGTAVVQVSWQYNLNIANDEPAFVVNALVSNTSNDKYLQLQICT